MARPSRKMRDLFGILKDKASISKAALFSKPNTSSLHLAILRATSHDPSTPPHDNHIAEILSFGHSSRVTASTCIESLMLRLQNTKNSFVAVKCLITIHNIIKSGSFILQDQLSIYPSTGGKNYLNLSNFRDDSSPETWELSSFIRWYARVLEYHLFTSRVLGFFLCSCSSSSNSCCTSKTQEEKVSALLNGELLKQIDVLVGLIEEICKATEFLNFGKNKLVYEVMGLVNGDYYSAQKGILIRINEVRERMGSFSFGDSVELICVLKRLENCREKVLLLFLNKIGTFVDVLWGLIGEMKDEIGKEKENEQGRMMMIRRRDKQSASARLGEGVMRSGESVRFGSGRLSLNWVPISIDESGSRF
ncbi:AP180 N-terminal homology (ANTH) domain [Macleaya cordata]|uniref:AP180 N-terminal homology (ANTH) domain n=1 Tax=Macleaya cordata TaxID=56857 RepID=A0A200RDT4_MACCD|nr:AP180 N-terminal homology (ANTH) domain [Macleaya cordata]